MDVGRDAVGGRVDRDRRVVHRVGDALEMKKPTDPRTGRRVTAPREKGGLRTPAGADSNDAAACNQSNRMHFLGNL